MAPICHGRRILLHCRQGARRYNSVSAARSPCPTAAEESSCNANLRCGDCFKANSGAEQVISVGDPRPAYDVHCPMLSLASDSGRRSIRFPCRVPYLYADPTLVERWRERLGTSDGRLNVGISWGGNPVNQHDRFRSVTAPACWLTPCRGARAMFGSSSLQKGPWAEQLKSPPNGLEIVDWTDELQDFADTAALMSALDMVITVCTATAHLAGALGCKTCVMLCFACDWRWLTDRSDSPWYPTMRPFPANSALIYGTTRSANPS